MSATDATTALTSRQRFRRALASLPVDRPPAWIMRQAGRYLPEYRALRERHSFLECVHSPEVAAEITCQPLARFPLDAAILFSDILITLEACGFDVAFGAGGPRVGRLETAAPLPEASASQRDAVFSRNVEALGLVRERIGEDRALLGFAGAPFTLACYAVDGGSSSDFPATRRLLHESPERFRDLLELLGDVVGDLLVRQVRAGCDAVQLFDTWAGLLSAEDYRTHVAPHTRSILARVREAGGRTILFTRDGGHLLPDTITSGADVVGLDWRVDVAAAARAAEGRVALQGNLDPLALCAPPAVIAARVRAIHAAIAGRTGHVMNLGHGVVPETPIAGVEAFLAAVAGLARP